MTRLIACAMLVPACAGAHAQAPSASEVLAKARSAYGSGAYAESITVEATDALGRTERSSIRVHALPTPTGDGVSQVRFELGRLRIWSEAGHMIVSAASAGAAPAPWWDARAEGADPIEMVELHVPPVCAPSIEILRGRTGLTPHSAPIVWNGVVEDPSGSGWLLAGRISDPSSGGGADRAVQATFDRESARLLRLIVSGSGAGGLVRLVVTATPVDAGDPGTWRPATDPSVARSSLAEVFVSRPRLETGDRFPAVSWVRSNGGSWRLNSQQTQPPLAPADVVARPTILVLWRVNADAGANASALSDARAATQEALNAMRLRRSEAIRSGAPRSPSPHLVCGAVFSIDAFDAEVFGAMAAEMSDLLAEEPGVVWTSPAQQTIDAIAPAAAAVLCVIDADGRLRSAVVVDGLTAMPESIATEIARAVDAAFGVAGAERPESP